jgi:DNA recombination protein RmuC
MQLITLTVVQVALLVVVLLVLWLRGRGTSADLVRQLTQMRTQSERIEPALREEMRTSRAESVEQAQQSRKEAREDARSLREELLSTVNTFGEKTCEAVAVSRREQAQASEQVREQIVGQLSEMRSEQGHMGVQVKDSVQTNLLALGGDLRDMNRHISVTVQERLGEVASEIHTLTLSNDQKLESIRQHVTGQLDELKVQHIRSSEQLTESVQANFSRVANDLRGTSRELNETVQHRLAEVGTKVSELSTANDRSQETLRKTVEDRLGKLNESTAQKLEEVRQTVDEKLHSTLEKRLTDCFGLVTEQLGTVQRGLGEMKDLATGVGDLKRVLTNIRSRGGYGEVQLEMLLDQMLAPEQYIKNATIRPGTQQTVEFAIKLPGTAHGECVLVPIDAKFPQEAWERLEDAQVRGDQESVKQAGDKLQAAICAAAKDISEKYVEPPLTTNFAIMFLPTEGLFAEVVRRPGLMDELQTKYRVTIAGPTTFAALLTSLQMGFRTLAIQKKGSEVWKVLAAAKSEFEKFGGLMERVEKNIGTVQNTLRDVGTRTRAIPRSLKDVEIADLQPIDATVLLGLNEAQEPEFDSPEAAPVPSAEE